MSLVFLGEGLQHVRKRLVTIDDSKTSKTVLPNVTRLACKSKAKIVSFTVDASVANVGARKRERYLKRNAPVTHD